MVLLAFLDTDLAFGVPDALDAAALDAPQYIGPSAQAVEPSIGVVVFADAADELVAAVARAAVGGLKTSEELR